MEDWEGEANWNCDVLERIVALLFALADLADLAAGLPLLRRKHVLGILSHGEAEARAFLFGGAPMPADILGEAGDAERLAIRLRSLALVLCALLTQAALFTRPRAPGLRTDRCKPGEPTGHQAQPRAPDTS